MWRRKGLDLFFQCSRKASHSIENQVPSTLLTLIRSPTSHFSSLLLQNKKLFSAISNPIVVFNGNSNSICQTPTLPSQTSVSEAKLFDEMPQRQRDNDQFETVLSILKKNKSLDESVLDKMDLTLNEKLMVRIIETPLVNGVVLIQFFKWASKKSNFGVNSQVLWCLVKAIGARHKKTEIFSLWDLVKKIGEKEKGVVDADILNKMIWLFWKLSRGEDGLRVFNKFEQFGCDPNADSYYFTIESLYRCSMFDDAWIICEKMLNAGKLPNTGAKIGHIISCFVAGNKPRNAHLVYLKAKEKNARPVVSSIKALIRLLSKENDTIKLAVELLNDLSGDGQKYAVKLFSSVLCSLCRFKDVEGAVKLLFKMIYEGPPPGNAAFNSVINLLSKAGRMEKVKDMVNLMGLRGLRPDVYTYCVIMSGYAKSGNMEEAHIVLSEAKKNHSKLTPVAYHILTRGYCRIEEFAKALDLLNEMKDGGIQPNADEYNKMIQSLCLKALDWKTAEKLLEEMKENGLHLNGNIEGLVRAVKELDENKLNAEKREYSSMDAS